MVPYGLNSIYFAFCAAYCIVYIGNAVKEERNARAARRKIWAWGGDQSSGGGVPRIFMMGGDRS